MEVPLFYQWVIELINPHCNPDEVIEVGRLRDLVAKRFKLSRPLVSTLLIEMKDMGLIEYNGVGKVRVIWKPEIVT